MRPFKNIEEFTAKTGKSIGSIIRIRYKADHDDIITGIIAAFEPVIKTLSIGNREHCLDDMASLFEYFNENIDEWLPFGVEETSTPAKFKVGKEYFCNYEKILINAKYRDPVDNKLKVVFNNSSIRTINTDKDGNETIIVCSNEIKAKNEVEE